MYKMYTYIKELLNDRSQERKKKKRPQGRLVKNMEQKQTRGQHGGLAVTLRN